MIKKLPTPVTQLGTSIDNATTDLLKWKKMFEALHPDIKVFIKTKDRPYDYIEEMVIGRYDFEFEMSLSNLIIFINLPSFMGEQYFAGFDSDHMFSHIDVESDPLLYDAFDIGCSPELHLWVECYLSTVIAIDRHNNRLPKPEIFIPARRMIVNASIKDNKVLLVKNGQVWRLPFAFYDLIAESAENEIDFLVKGVSLLLPKVTCTNLSFVNFFFPWCPQYQIRYPCMVYTGKIFGDLTEFGDDIHECRYFSYEEISSVITTREVTGVFELLINYQKIRYTPLGDLE